MTFRLKRDHKKKFVTVIREIFSLFQEKNKTEFKKISESEKWFGKFGIKTSLEQKTDEEVFKKYFLLFDW